MISRLIMLLPLILLIFLTSVGMKQCEKSACEDNSLFCSERDVL